MKRLLAPFLLLAVVTAMLVAPAPATAGAKVVIQSAEMAQALREAPASSATFPGTLQSDTQFPFVDQAIASGAPVMDAQGRVILLAQNTPDAAAPATSVPDVNLPAKVATESDALRTALAAAQGHQWLLLVGSILSIVLLLAKRFLSFYPLSDRWGYLLGVGVPILIALVTSMVTGTWGWQTLLDVVNSAGSALITFATLKKGLAGKPAPTPTPSS